MKKAYLFLPGILVLLWLANLQAQLSRPNRLFIDVHLFHPGSISTADIATAHARNLAVETKYDVHFIKYWIDEKAGTVYWLSSAPDSAHVANAHNEASGLLPQQVYAVTAGTSAKPLNGVAYYLDIHSTGAGKITLSSVEAGHRRMLAVQKKYAVNFINYWFCEDQGIVFCLSQAENKSNVAGAHREGQGVVPAMIAKVVQGP